MARLFFKYVSVIVFLFLGIEAVWSLSCHELPGQNENVCSVSVQTAGSADSFDHIYDAITDTFAVLWRTESIKVTKNEEGIEFYKILPCYSKNVSANPFICGCYPNFTNVLSERHIQGFYIYTLKKLII